MTKQDILKMKTCAEVTHTIFTHRELWDKDVYDYQMKLKRQENTRDYGDPDVLVDPLNRK